MPWSQTTTMHQRMLFIADHLRGIWSSEHHRTCIPHHCARSLAISRRWSIRITMKCAVRPRQPSRSSKSSPQTGRRSAIEPKDTFRRSPDH